MSDEQLVQGLVDACLRAGRSNSGLCITASTESDMKRARDYRDALLLRLKELRSQLRQATVPE